VGREAVAAGAGERRRHESLTWGQVGVVLAYVLVAVWYLTWRPSTFNPAAPGFSRLVFGAELFGFVMAALHIFMVWRLSVREPPTARAGLSVDVFVTCYDEPVEMLRRTLLGALRMRYPHETWLLDDGNRPEMRALAAELGARYLARGDNRDAKAGNLNHALRHATGDFVALFDADHVPAADFLDRTLGYFGDDAVAVVTTPQDFYNLDSYQHRRSRRWPVVWNEQLLFFRVIQRGKDYWDASFFSGTCGVLRRRALDDIGGFSTATVTEDLDTSVRLHARGWKSVYHAESLAFGLAPTDVVPYVRQRARWGQGAMQVMRRYGFFLFCRGLTLPQRLCYFASVLMYFDGWQKAVLYVAPAIVLLTGTMPVAEVSWPFLARFIPYYVLTFWAFEEVSRGYGRSVETERFNMARFATFAWATLALLRGRGRFRVTRKQRGAGGTGDAVGRYTLPQTIVWLANGVAIPLGILLNARNAWLPLGAVAANVVWAMVNVGLATMVLRITRRIAQFRRREYRFPLPLPVALRFGTDAPTPGVVDDVSAEGFRYYGRFPDAIVAGDRVEGALMLPGASIPLQGTVRTVFRDAHGAPRALGCRFAWQGHRHHDTLARFLYGSGVQWPLNGLTEARPTPTQRIAAIFRGDAADADGAGRRWASALCMPARRDAGESCVCVVSVDREDSSRERTMVTFQPLGDELPVFLEVTTRVGTTLLGARAFLRHAIDSGAGQPLYVYRLEGARVRFRRSFA
jgi:cellulose synthase (UDP-forming)